MTTNVTQLDWIELRKIKGRSANDRTQPVRRHTRPDKLKVISAAQTVHTKCCHCCEQVLSCGIGDWLFLFGTGFMHFFGKILWFSRGLGFSQISLNSWCIFTIHLIYSNMYSTCISKLMLLNIKDLSNGKCALLTRQWLVVCNGYTCINIGYVIFSFSISCLNLPKLILISFWRLSKNIYWKNLSRFFKRQILNVHNFSDLKIKFHDIPCLKFQFPWFSRTSTTPAHTIITPRLPKLLPVFCLWFNMRKVIWLLFRIFPSLSYFLSDYPTLAFLKVICLGLV